MMGTGAATSKRVLVTGSAGAIGRVVCKRLVERGHRVRGFDRLPASNLDDAIVGDIRDREQMAEAVAGINTVVHLAAVTDDADFADVLLEPNVRGLFVVCDSARNAGVERLVLVSSLQTVEGHGWTGPTIRLADGPAPTNHYGLTKVWAEAMGEMYARQYGLSVICPRLGWFPRDAEDARRLNGHEIGPRVYLSHDDAGRFFERCVESQTPQPGEFAIVFAVSRSTGHAAMDLKPARRILGYKPQDSWPKGLSFSF